MTTYVVLLPGDEATWESASGGAPRRDVRPARRVRAAARRARAHHHRRRRAAPLHARPRVVRRDGDGIAVTDGPYAETVEQLTGYYVVDTDDLDDLLEVCGIARRTPRARVEVRAAVGGADGPTCMRFLVLMAEADHFAKWDAADEELRARVIADFQAFDAAVARAGHDRRRRGAWTGPRPPAPSGRATSGRVTDGPFAETVEQLGGFYLIDVTRPRRPPSSSPPCCRGSTPSRCAPTPRGSTRDPARGRCCATSGAGCWPCSSRSSAGSTWPRTGWPRRSRPRPGPGTTRPRQPAGLAADRGPAADPRPVARRGGGGAQAAAARGRGIRAGGGAAGDGRCRRAGARRAAAAGAALRAPVAARGVGGRPDPAPGARRARPRTSPGCSWCRRRPWPRG